MNPPSFSWRVLAFLQFSNLVQVHFCNRIVTEHRNDHFYLVATVEAELAATEGQADSIEEIVEVVEGDNA